MGHRETLLVLGFCYLVPSTRNVALFLVDDSDWVSPLMLVNPIVGQNYVKVLISPKIVLL